MDVTMPEMNGLAATQLIRRVRPTIKVIVLSGH
jgi:YesN/AraC family two-component response regulator